MRKGASSAVIFGIALAGFLDGIVLHSILQWHHMISSVIPPADMRGMSTNMLADGLFDLFCWVLTVCALVLLLRERNRATLLDARTYWSWMLVGGGGFNLVEGIVDHEVLGIHHVHPGPNWLAWDIGFLVLGGLLLMAIGWFLKREPHRQSGAIESREAA
jgi:uncharacterized membrane protein